MPMANNGMIRRITALNVSVGNVVPLEKLFGFNINRYPYGTRKIGAGKVVVETMKRK